jgi:hypothetical protein
MHARALNHWRLPRPQGCVADAVALVSLDVGWSLPVQGVRDMVKKWLMSFMEIGGLMKRLDIGEGAYTKELEEDYDVWDAMNQVGRK